MAPYTIYSTGDSSVTIDLGALISEALNRKVLAMETWLRANAPEGIKEIVTAYSSLCIHFDFMQVRKLSDNNAYQYISERLQNAFNHAEVHEEEKVIIKIPVCYDAGFGIDQQEICNRKKIGREELIRLHTAVDYRVYMIGFLPGFPYMGKVDAAIAVPRKSKPRPQVAKGSVGIAGVQTGIYSLPSPGGWQIIGRTPFRLFQPDNHEMVSLRAGNYVRFFSIPREEFEELNH